MLEPLKIADYTDFHRRALRSQIANLIYVPKGQVDSVYLLRRTLKKWNSILTPILTIRDAKYIANNLDDLKIKLENRVLDWSSYIGGTVVFLVRLADQLDNAIEDGLDLISLQTELIEFVQEHEEIEDDLEITSLFYPPYTIHERDWLQARALMETYDPELTDKIDAEIQWRIVS